MNATQKTTLDTIMTALLSRDSFRARELKREPLVEELANDKVLLQVHTGYVNDENTGLELFCRETWMLVIGTRGGVEVMCAPKSWEQFRGHYAYLGNRRVAVRSSASFY
jgi:hypothetical protein